MGPGSGAKPHSQPPPAPSLLGCSASGVSQPAPECQVHPRPAVVGGGDGGAASRPTPRAAFPPISAEPAGPYKTAVPDKSTIGTCFAPRRPWGWAAGGGRQGEAAGSAAALLSAALPTPFPMTPFEIYPPYRRRLAGGQLQGLCVQLRKAAFRLAGLCPGTMWGDLGRKEGRAIRHREGLLAHARAHTYRPEGGHLPVRLPCPSPQEPASSSLPPDPQPAAPPLPPGPPPLPTPDPPGTPSANVY